MNSERLCLTAYTPATNESYPPFINFSVEGDQMIVTLRGSTKLNDDGTTHYSETNSISIDTITARSLLTEALKNLNEFQNF